MPTDFQVNLADYAYNLSDERIAKHGLSLREGSRLLFYKEGNIHDQTFSDITQLIPDNSTLFFNDTKVIQARLKMRRATGAMIEIFLLSPISPPDMAQALSATEPLVWSCMIGNLKKWQDEEILSTSCQIRDKEVVLQTKLINRSKRSVEFSWDSTTVSFGELIDILGKTPLPPYLNRPAETDDKARYQTVYSRVEGAVAAPTAGLHFTPQILNQLKSRGVKQEFLTLHVSAGTFQPIQAKDVTEHPMHNERVYVSKANLEAAIASDNIIPVGTTSMRTLESVFWFGCKLLKDPNALFFIEKLLPYNTEATLPSKLDALQAVLSYMNKHNLAVLEGETEIFIFPGYTFRMCAGLITNFHQPGSTLILLVAAFIGADWRRVYDHALTHDYRFLSYGDSSFLLPQRL